MHIFQKPQLPVVQALLDEHELPASDLDETAMQHFFGCGENANPQGVVGIEVLGDLALLRSLSVSADAGGQGCGSALVASAESHARSLGIKSLYLLTNTAEAFFRRRGYAVVARDSVPEAIRQTREFSSLCPDSAVVMKKELGDP